MGCHHYYNGVWTVPPLVTIVVAILVVPAFLADQSCTSSYCYCSVSAMLQVVQPQVRPSSSLSSQSSSSSSSPFSLVDEDEDDSNNNRNNTNATTTNLMEVVASYDSIPAIYYGKSWSSNDPPILVQLYYFDNTAIDWCQEADQLDPQRNPISKAQQQQQQQQHHYSHQLPIAVLINDSPRSDEYGHYNCHLIDYERIATIWNISYIIFYDSHKINRHHPHQELSYIWTYLDDRLLGMDDKDVGFQLVSYQTGMELQSMTLNQNNKDDNTTTNGGNANMTGNNGIIIQIDGRSSINPPPPRFDPRIVLIRKAVAIIPKFTGMLSFIGSTYIFLSIIRTRSAGGRRNTKLKSTFYRLLAALSVADTISSTMFIISHWAFPTQPQVGTDPDWYNVDFPYASGSTATCTAQGFLMYIGTVSSILFTAFISIQFVLQVRYGWRERMLRKAEKVFFSIGIVFPLLIGIIIVSVGAINVGPAGICYVETNPYVCEESYLGWCKENKVFGEQLQLYLLLTSELFILLGLTTVLISMLLLYITVRQQEQTVSQWSINSGCVQKAVLQKGLLILGSYILVYFSVIAAFQTHSHGSKVMLVTVLPLQGFLNAMIYSKKYLWITQHICFCRRGSSSSPSSSGIEQNNGRSRRSPPQTIEIRGGSRGRGGRSNNDGPELFESPHPFKKLKQMFSSPLPPASQQKGPALNNNHDSTAICKREDNASTISTNAASTTDTGGGGGAGAENRRVGDNKIDKEENSCCDNSADGSSSASSVGYIHRCDLSHNSAEGSSSASSVGDDPRSASVDISGRFRNPPFSSV